MALKANLDHKKAKEFINQSNIPMNYPTFKIELDINRAKA